MRMKQISAANMQEAMLFARRQLGEDAVLLEQRKSGQGVIVTFAVEDESPLPDLSDDPPPAPPPSARTPTQPASPAAASAAAAPASRGFLTDAIANHRLPAPLSATLQAAITARAGSGAVTVEAAQEALSQACLNLVRLSPILTTTPPPARALMLVGPHGAGKTSSIIKLATELTRNQQPLTLISCDRERLGGAESLEKLATLLGANFHIAETRAPLKALLPRAIGAGWVLIDSAGVNCYAFEEMKKLGELASLNLVEPVLVVPGGLDAEESAEMASVFDFLAIERMIVTRLDAVRRLGSVFSALARGSYALANYTDSAAATAACHPFTTDALAAFLLRSARDTLQR